MHDRKRDVKRAFTLIELLVVVSIIALLVSILLPSLQKSREQAKAVICLSNMKGQGNLFQIYAAENNGMYPAHNNMWPSTLRDWNYPGSGSPISRRPDVYTSDLVTSLKPYVGDPAVLYCPLRKKGDIETGVGPRRYSYPSDHPAMAGWYGGPKDDIAFRDCDYSLWFNFRTRESLMPGAAADTGITYYKTTKPIRRMDDANGSSAIASEGTGVNPVGADMDVMNWMFRNGMTYPPQVTAHPFAVGGSNVLYGDFHAEKRKWNVIEARISVYSGPLVIFYW